MIPQDGGPLYTETQMGRTIVEPFNMVTAIPYFLLALYWLFRLRNEWRQQTLFLIFCILLAIGGIGGTLYHGLRSSRVFLLMDFLPIALIAMIASWYFWKLSLKSGGLAVIAAVPFLVLNRAAFHFLPRVMAINASYFFLGVMVLAPIFWMLRKTGWKDATTVWKALGFFLVGLAFRVWDPYSGNWFPMGTHWLWHLFSFVAVLLLMGFVYRLRKTNAGQVG